MAGDKYLILICTFSFLCSVTCELNQTEGVTAAALLCLSGDFDSQLRHILHEQMLSTQHSADILSRVLADVRRTLRQRWQDFKLNPYGSMTIGAGTKSSDVDISLNIRNYSFSPASYVTETRELFQKQPALYTDLNSEEYSKCTRFSFIHIPTQRKIDLNNISDDEAIAHANIMKYYFNLDERILPLVRFLRYFFQIHGLVGHGSMKLTNRSLYLLIVFYLQQKNMAPPVYMLQKDTISHFFNIWNKGFNEMSYRSTNTENLHQLLGGFFKYYSEFNFEEYIVSPFAGRPIPRSSSLDIDNCDTEYFLNNNFNRTIQKVRNYLNCTDLCIQDVFYLDSNQGAWQSHEQVMAFKYLLKAVATMFEDLPADSILRAILVTEQHKETASNNSNAAMDGINEQDCIEVPDIS